MPRICLVHRFRTLSWWKKPWTCKNVVLLHLVSSCFVRPQWWAVHFHQLVFENIISAIQPCWCYDLLVNRWLYQPRITALMAQHGWCTGTPWNPLEPSPEVPQLLSDRSWCPWCGQRFRPCRWRVWSPCWILCSSKSWGARTWHGRALPGRSWAGRGRNFRGRFLGRLANNDPGVFWRMMLVWFLPIIAEVCSQ